MSVDQGRKDGEELTPLTSNGRLPWGKGVGAEKEGGQSCSLSVNRKPKT